MRGLDEGVIRRPVESIVFVAVGYDCPFQRRCSESFFAVMNGPVIRSPVMTWSLHGELATQA